ncbi:hypothetical protein Tfer_0111 [Thermincola ferriacetica]|uniref:Type I phosphodiesterase/nucleotide pyrophosphatase n=1 Tax=Thermincola ferriacetica TaxID=281456 RepID=A0A0L6W629_9FIRM|nr:hypothetical protein [Thermincola ferriacetica]KNZ71037.1 hypothetical protein Tfer_0111 [Thermincola ferriacetica]
MKFRQLSFIVLICFAINLILGGTGYAAHEGQSQKNEDTEKVLKHVFFIILEGVSSKDLRSAYTPNISGIAASGIQGSAIGVLPETTEAFLVALLKGQMPEVNTGNAIRNDQLAVGSLPALLDSSGRSSVFIDDGRKSFDALFRGLKRYRVKEQINIKEIDQAVVDLAIDKFSQKHPFFMGLILPGTELTRKSRDSTTKKTMVALNRADEQVGKLLRELRSQGLFENSLIVITGSATYNDAGQGDWTIENNMLPLIMTGPGLKTGIQAPPARIIDVAPTVALLVGVYLNPHPDGLVLWNFLLAGEGFTEANLMKKRLTELSSAHIDSITEIYRLNHEKASINIAKERINKEKREVEDKINRKQEEVNRLRFKLNAFKMTGIMFLLVVGAGYIVEYYILRRKFLMF